MPPCDAIQPPTLAELLNNPVIEHEVNEEFGYVTISFAGELVLDEMQSCEDRLLADDRVQKSMPRIYDLTGIDLNLNTSELVRFVEICRDWEIPEDTRVAMVGNSGSMATINLFVGHFVDQALYACQNMRQATRWISEGELPDLSGDDRYKVIALRGTITLDDILREQALWYKDSLYDPSKPVLWDLRNTTAGSSIIEMRDRRPFVLSSSQGAGRTGRTSMLVNSHIMELLIKELIELGGWRDASRLFNKEDEAIAWVTAQEN